MSDESSAVSRNWIIYTDGPCKGQPGPGGWGVLMISGRAASCMAAAKR